jgi:ABC-type lipoprotein release transport system permease subunit
MEVGGNRSFAQIIGLVPDSRMRKLGIKFSDDHALEVVLNGNLWKGNHLKAGDSVLIDTAKGRYTMRLIGIVEEVTVGIEYDYLPLGTAQDILGQEGKYTGIWTNSNLGSADTKRVLYKEEMISVVTDKKDIAAIIDQFMVSLKAGLLSIRIMTMSLAPIFLFASMGLSLLEKERDFIILRSMGSKKGKVLGILMTEALVVGFFSMLFCIPLAFLMGWAMNVMHRHIHYALYTHVQPSDFFIVLWCFPLFPLVALIFSWRISRINITQALTGRMG